MSLRALLALVLLLASSTPVSAQVPGCINGVLADPKAYFFHLIGRQEGQPADDFAAVLRASGLPAGYPPHVTPTDNGFYGLTQQIGGSGRIAGRIFLPTATPDDLGYYSHPFSPLKDGPTPGSLLWEWRDLGGPPYAPRACAGSTPPPVTPPPSLEPVLAAIKELAAKVEALSERLAQAGETGREQMDLIKAEILEFRTRPFPCFGGRLGGAVPVTLCPKQ